MKRLYTTPEMEIVRFKLSDVLTNSVIEPTTSHDGIEDPEPISKWEEDLDD